jgi:hypothetical protein
MRERVNLATEKEFMTRTGSSFIRACVPTFTRAAPWLASTLILSLTPPVHAQWSSAVNLSNSPNFWSVDGAMDLDANGKVHIVYDDWWDSPHYLYYVENTTGVWSAPQLVVGARNPVLRITPDQVLHLFYKVDSAIWEVTRQIGTLYWSAQVQVSHDGEGDRWPAWAAVNAGGGLYFAYLHLWNDATSTPSALWGRYKPLGGSWGAVELIEKGSDRDHWPAASQVIANGNDIYATWEINPGSGTVPKYKKRQAGVWGSAVQMDGSGGAARLAFSPTGEMAFAWSKDVNSGSAWYEVFAKFSTDGGAAWSVPFNVSDMHEGLDRTPEITYDAAGNFHIVYQRFDCDGCPPEMWYRQRTAAGAWQAKYNLTNTSGRTESPFQCIRAHGTVLHFIYSDSTANGVEDLFYKTTASTPPPNSGTIQGYVTNASGQPVNGASVVTSPGNFAGPTGPSGVYTISGVPVGTYTATAMKPYYVSSSVGGVVVQQNQITSVNLTINGTPPADATSFAVTPGNQSNHLTWTHSASGNSSGVVIRVKTAGYPSGPGDGTLVADLPAPSGAAGSCDHAGLNNGTTYYYRAFAYYEDRDRYYSGGVNAAGTPAGPADMDRDGDVDQADFGLFQACLTGPFSPQDDPACQRAKLDGDTDVDIDDSDLFVGCVSGPGASANPNCAG